MVRIAGLCVLSASLCRAGVIDQLPKSYDETMPGVVAGARADEPCPTDAITGQAPGACVSTRWFFYSDLEFCSGTRCQRVRCDDFPPSGNLDPNDPNDWIGKITWYGVYVDNSTAGCTKTGGHQFRIRFYPPDPNDPNNVLRDANGVPIWNYEELLVAFAYDTGETVDFGSGPAIRWLWTAVLTTPRQESRAWFSIVGAGTPGCYFLWEGSNQGNNRFANWYEQPFGLFEYRTTFCDQNWCLFADPRGACCRAGTGECENDVPEHTCQGPWDLFFANQTCDQISPPCDERYGACCFDDGLCTWVPADMCGSLIGDLDCDGDVDFDDINPFVTVLLGGVLPPGCLEANADCNRDGVIDFGDINGLVCILAQLCPLIHGMWLGPGIPCSECPCRVAPGSPSEDEPPCGDGYVDTFNGGCDSMPPVFSAITAGMTVYGKSGTYYTGGNRRDTDWYAFTTDAYAILSATVEAEFDVELVIFHSGDCDPNDPTYWTAASATGAECTPVTATTVPCVPGGVYWVVVRPQYFSGVPCGADYSLTLANPIQCPQCHITCVPDYTEQEPCGENTNPGCGVPPGMPPQFEPLPALQSGVPLTICGTAWASNWGRDLDWYSFTLPARGVLTWEYESELPIRSTPVFGSGNFDPPDCNGSMWGYFGVAATTPCEPPGDIVHVAPADVFRANTTYWWVVWPEAEHAYPCSEGEVDYRLTITYTQVECPDVCGGQIYEEYEPSCGPGYVDTFNGGCDAATFAIQPAIAYVYSYCGRSGTWVISVSLTC
jgi:hypothetical protein